jgi:hypothetical protein
VRQHTAKQESVCIAVAQVAARACIESGSIFWLRTVQWHHSPPK